MIIIQLHSGFQLLKYIFSLCPFFDLESQTPSGPTKQKGRKNVIYNNINAIATFENSKDILHFVVQNMFFSSLVVYLFQLFPFTYISLKSFVVCLDFVYFR